MPKSAQILKNATQCQLERFHIKNFAKRSYLDDYPKICSIKDQEQIIITIVNTN